ncbi:mitoguardin 1 isoform X2 [Rhinatrema bivittatum]|uniref:mitoguardin 1 isoform X2 n=1 Tax=Rhinatrema bivittatum TaxID=194408 RepID=UPI0011284FA7|nr:mitoguardin 1 isoform X2 [Rhinatrema bivittatum]
MRDPIMSAESIKEPHSSLKGIALQVFHFPVAWYHSLIQVKFSPGFKKLFIVSAVSAVSLIFLAHHFKRRHGKKKRKESPWEPSNLVLECSKTAASEKGSSCSSSRQNLTLSLSSAKEKGPPSCSLYVNGGVYSKYSGSVQSLASVRSANSCHSCACLNNNSWDKEEDVKLVNIPVTTPESLYLMGMELFEEALHRWEQALTFRNRQAEDEANSSSIKLGAGDAIAEESVEDIISAEFIHKLEALLQRAYRLQEEFEATLGASDPASLANDIDKDTDITVKDSTDDFGLRDTLSIASTDSFVSAAELSEHREIRNSHGLGSLCHCPLYEDAMHLAEEGKIYSRVLRTEMLECLGDSDFLAKLHCVREAFQVILSETNNRMFLAETGRKMLSALILKAKKNPKKFEDVFDEMLYFLEQKDHWDNTKMELFARGVKKLNFYDIVLDFILMDSFEDLENPPFSIQNVVNNRWLNSSFKETDQALYFLKDIFDFEKVRYSNAESLAEDIMQLLHRRTELFMAYLGADSLRHVSSCVSERELDVSNGSVEAKVQ